MLTKTLRLGALAAAIATTALAGCANIEVQDGDMFRRSKSEAPADWLTKAREQAGDRFALEPVRFAGADGTELGGLFLRRPGAQTTVVYFQGGGNTVAKTWPYLLKQSAELPANVLFWDYRGMGLSGGTGGTPQMRNDARAAVQEARRLSGEALPVVYWGFSLGTVIGANLAQDLPPDALVLEGPITTAEEWARNKVPWYAKPFVQITLADTVRAYDNRVALADLRRPTLLLVGANDDTTPPAFARSIEQQIKARQCVTVVEVPEAGHGNSIDKPAGRGALLALIERGRQRQGC